MKERKRQKIIKKQGRKTKKKEGYESSLKRMRKRRKKIWIGKAI